MNSDAFDYNRSIDHLISILEGVGVEKLTDADRMNWLYPEMRAATTTASMLRVPAPTANIASKWNKKRATAIPRLICSFCKKNGETRQLYSSHVLKDGNGTIVCPVLRRYVCPICNQAGGDNAHTKRFCPLNPDRSAREGKPIPEILKERPNSTGKRFRSN